MATQGRIRAIALALADAVCVVSVWVAVVYGYWFLGLLLRTHGWPGCPCGGYDPAYYLDFWPVPIAFVACNAIFELYHGNWMYPSAPLSPVEEFRRLCCSSLVVHIVVVAIFAIAYGTINGFSRFVTLFSGALVALGAQSFRSWMRSLLFKTGLGQIPVALAGDGPTARHVLATLRNDVYTGFRVAMTFGHDQLREVVPTARRSDIKILLACMDERLFRCQLEDFASWFTYIEYLPTNKAFPVFGSRTVSFDGIGGLEMVNQGRMKVKRVQKRLLDLLLSVLAFICLSPFFIILPVLIKSTSRGPVFFRHSRLGRYEQPFQVWKFRSMYEDADARLAHVLATDPQAAAEWKQNFKLKRDPRVTPLGRFLRKTSLDELPQLFNVFRGEMALIGPRPIVDEEVAYYGDSYSVFSSVRPGITGLWQVSGRSDTDYEQRVALDSYYVLNWSMWMDMWILVRTVYAVLFMRGAC